jgi:hypothetical protein
MRSSLAGACLCLAACARGSGGAGGGGGSGLPPPPGSEDPPFLPGLVAAAAGPNEVRVDWIEAESGFELALFQGLSRASVYSSAPVAEVLAGDHLVLQGLANSVDLFFGLGLRAVGDSEWTPIGVILRARPGPVIYVDAASSAASPDGTTPATAFADLFLGLLVALGQGGGNVWVRDGDYTGAVLPLVAGVHVYGGFDGTFELDTRAARAHRTILRGPAGQRLLDVGGGEPAAVLDGFALRGEGTAQSGIDVGDSSLELRCVDLVGFASRAARLSNLSTSASYDFLAVDCGFESNGGEGVLLSGAFDVVIDGSRFDGNGLEGAQLDDLVARDGSTATLSVRGSRFFGNASEGLDVDLAAPLLQGPNGGVFALEIDASRFEQNGTDGLDVDVDYETASAWRGTLALRGVRLRANRGHGARVDGDSTLDVAIERTLASANEGDGIWISSESAPGLAIVSASVCSGNHGAGLRASLGNRPVLASHCVFAGNAGGGFASELVTSSAASCVAWLQGTPWIGVERVGSLELDDPQSGAFERAPEAYARVLSSAGATAVLEDASAIALGASTELGDDDVELVVQAVNGSTVTFDESPMGFVAPGALSAFAAQAGVFDDWRLPPGSPCAGAGMSAPGAPAVDAGVWGSPSAGFPGVAQALDGPLLVLADATPTPTARIDAHDAIALRFSRALDPASVGLDALRVVSDSGTEIAALTTVLGDTLTLLPPGAGWGSEPFVVELHRAIRAADGTPHSAPLVVPYVP